MRRVVAILVFAVAGSACFQTDAVPSLDAGPGSNVGETCSQIVSCLNTCSDQTCASVCEEAGSLNAQQILSTLTGCIDSSCSNSAGAPCADSASTACDDCLTAVQSPDGGCFSDLVACDSEQGDTPDAGTPMATLGCGGINDCIDNCDVGDDTCQQNCFNQGTSTGQELFNSTNTCFIDACAETDGGVCAMDTSQCQSCIVDAEAMGGSCNSVLTMCTGDMSGTGSSVAPAGTGGCSALVGCRQGCAAGDDTCTEACQAATTMQGAQLFDTLLNCLFTTACSSASGGVCETDTTDCDSCVSAAQMAGGTCFGQFTSCKGN